MSNIEQAQKIIDIMLHHGERMKHCNKYKRDETHQIIMRCAFLSEVGEVFDKIVKASRDDWNKEKFIDGMRKEIGDVFWYLCQNMLDPISLERRTEIEYNVLVNSIKDSFTEVDSSLGAGATNRNTNAYQYAIYPLMEACAPLSTFNENLASIITFISEDWLCIFEPLTESHTIIGRIQSILDENYAKIMSRYERGVISGSGDNR